MTSSEYEQVAQALLDAAKAIEDSKRPGYTIGSADVLANFKSVAARAGLTPGQAWTVYFLKHIDAITAIMCKPELPVSEAPEGRFADAVNYLKLGWAILQERQTPTNIDYAQLAQLAEERRFVGGCVTYTGLGDD
jgi:hypothetical protein